jgi:23S rRNA (pseudouridine1915-N3)-methyltransferase
MKTIKIYAVGKVKERNISALIEEYQKRLKVFAKVEIIELKDMGIIKESDEIIKLADSNSLILDELGVTYSSVGFSELINNKDNIKFFIGGAEGISKEAKSKVKTIALSKMTFTHEMARLFLVEQIYRAMMIINNRNYHK